VILFKEGVTPRDLAKIHPKLRRIVDWMSTYVWQNYTDDLVVTDIYRDDPASPHAYFRAIDFAMLEHGDSEHLRYLVNSMFPYGDGKHETIVPLQHGSSPHVHVQVSGTELKET
jgi:hypothetical protein